MPIDDSAELLAALKKISARAVLRRPSLAKGFISDGETAEEYAHEIVTLLAQARTRHPDIEQAIIEELSSGTGRGAK